MKQVDRQIQMVSRAVIEERGGGRQRIVAAEIPFQ